MEKFQSDLVTVVTGASGALGSALVQYLTRRGERVVAVSRREASPPISETERGNANVIPFALEGSGWESWPPLMERIVHEYGPPKGAVLAAGGYRGGNRCYEGDLKFTLKTMLESNLESASAAMAALLGPMLSVKTGSIVLIGSRAAARPWEGAGAAAYAASKAALIALTQATAAEVLKDGVRVNAVLPSTIDTPQNRKAMPDADFSSWVSLASLCDVIGFLLSDASRDISGATLPVYGRVGS